MSAIAALVRWRQPADLREGIQAMTGRMRMRGPHGLRHWVGAPAALGHCAFDTTGEDDARAQPIEDDKSGVVLVMDGQVHNHEELRHALGAGHEPPWSDVHAVLRSWEAWGERCPEHLAGEFVFAIWDPRRQSLFAARDAVGVRHLVYTRLPGGFALASEANALRALPEVQAGLNQAKLLDYLVMQHDRDDVQETFFQGIFKLPAGHAMQVDPAGWRSWRYWNPAELPPARYASLDECGEAFRAMLMTTTAARLRSRGTVGSLLSGGLDSSSIAGLVRGPLRGEVRAPLRTFSLVPPGAQAPERLAVQAMLADGWFQPTLIELDHVRAACADFLRRIPDEDNPFAFGCFPTSLAFRAAAAQQCDVVLEGMAGDLMFYGPDRCDQVIVNRRLFKAVPGLAAARRRHGLSATLPRLAYRAAARLTPAPLRLAFRRLGDRDARQHLGPEIAGDNFRRLRPEVARAFLLRKRGDTAARPRPPVNDQALHAEYFTGGLMSFAHEIEGNVALRLGVEERSPFSDRRMVEFAIRMPLQYKLWDGWYKLLTRRAMHAELPSATAWRTDVGQHPGWMYKDALFDEIAREAGWMLEPAYILEVLEPWIDRARLCEMWQVLAREPSSALQENVLAIAFLAQWMHTCF